MSKQFLWQVIVVVVVLTTNSAEDLEIYQSGKNRRHRRHQVGQHEKK